MDMESCIVIWALGLLAILEMWALYLGHNGALLAGVIAIFGYAAGYKHRKAKEKPLFS